MSRRLNQTFQCAPLGDLARQLLYAPTAKRFDQVRRAEWLHDQIDPDRAYPLDFLWYRITGYHPEVAMGALLAGDQVKQDLRLLIDSLSRSAPIPVEEGEPIELPRELATRLNVSTKTLDRWRRLGLRWRWVQAPGRRRPCVGYTQSAVQHFLKAHPDRVDRAARYQYIPPQTRDRLIQRARRIAGARDVSFNQVATHLARRCGWAHETIRLLLEKHDRENPDRRIFIDRTAPLTARQQRVIGRAYRMGVPVSSLARRFQRTASTIYRAIHRRRVLALRRLAITYVHLPIFDHPDADDVLLQPEPKVIAPADSSDSPRPPAMPAADDLPSELVTLYRQPALDSSLQRSLLVRFNYMKFKASRQRDALSYRDPRAKDLDHIEQWLKEAATLRDRLVAGNLSMVLSVARRHTLDRDSSSQHRLMELLAIGNVVLLEAIDTFDLTKSKRFDGYLTWRLMQGFGLFLAQTAGRAHRRLDPLAVLKRLESTGIVPNDAR